MVEVRYVPLHSDYSQRVRQKYWNSAQELWDMAARNSVEFAAEGYDWTKAVEEEVSEHTFNPRRLHSRSYFRISHRGEGSSSTPHISKATTSSHCSDHPWLEDRSKNMFMVDTPIQAG